MTNQANAIRKAHELLEQFLGTPDHPKFNESDGGYAPCSKEEQLEFYKLLNAIIEAKFAPDCDGDLPIEYTIVNRNTHERLHFLPMPYYFDADRDQLLKALRIANVNAGLGRSEVDRLINILSHYE